MISMHMKPGYGHVSSSVQAMLLWLIVWLVRAWAWSSDVRRSAGEVVAVGVTVLPRPSGSLVLASGG